MQENIKARGIIVDVTLDSGNYVQEVWFVAPPEVFDDFIDDAEQIFGSLKWTQNAESLKEAALSN